MRLAQRVPQLEAVGVQLERLFELVDGGVADDLGAVLGAVQKGDFPSPRSVDPSIDPALEAVCLKAMALKPEDRYRSPRELAEEIPCILLHEVGLAVTTRAQVVQRRQSHRT